MVDLVLGVGLLGHDAAATLVREDGAILYALTEERFSNLKHDGNFPTAAISHICERVRDQKLGVIRHVGMNHDPSLFTKKKLFHYVEARLPREVAAVYTAAIEEVFPYTHHVRPDLYPMTYLWHVLMKTGIDDALREDIFRRTLWCLGRSVFLGSFLSYLQRKFSECEVVGVPHHKCHAASAFYASGFETSAILGIDGMGEDDTITLWRGDSKGLHLRSATGWPHSLGILYTAFTTFLGFAGFGDEYKVMGMAAYGQPRYAHLFKDMGHVDEQGRLTLRFGDLLVTSDLVSCPGEYALALGRRFQNLLGGPRFKDQPFEQRHYDIARSLQDFVEDMGLQIARRLKAIEPDMTDLCIAGGVGLNGLMNQKIREKSGFSRVFVQPAATDDGTTLGAALALVAEKYAPPKPTRLRHMFWGLDYPPELAQKAVADRGLVFSRPSDLAGEIAALLAAGKIVARYEGRSEFGPRALGHRSILASPLTASMKDVLNARIKHREMFRPFAPACLAEHVRAYFETDEEAEYMLFICQVRPEKRALIPAVVHVDGTARVQSVRREANPGLYAIIQAFDKITGVPVIINTSFNVNGEAIVETPEDALACFLYTDIDYLAIEDMLIAKADNLDKSLSHLSSDDFLALRKNRYRAAHDSHELFITPIHGSFGITPADIHREEARQNEDAAQRLTRRAIQDGFVETYIAGAGSFARMILFYARAWGLDVAGFTDTTPSKIGTEQDGLPILAVEAALRKGIVNFLVGSNRHEQAIRAHLEAFAQKESRAIRVLSLQDVGW